MVEASNVKHLMVRDVKMSLSTDDLSTVLRQLQGRVYFEKTVRASSVPKYCPPPPTMALPAWFVEKYGDKFRKRVVLRTGSSTQSWAVKLTIYHNSPRTTQVKFAGGWNAFATSNGLVEGDLLLFSLTAMSEFDVYIFHGPGNPEGFSSQAPRKWSNASGHPRKKVKKSYECRSEHLAAHGFVTKNKRTSGEEVTAPAPYRTETFLRNSSYCNDIPDLNELENEQGSSSRSHHSDFHSGHEPAPAGYGELIMPGLCENGTVEHIDVRNMCAVNEYQGLALQKARKPPLPGFLKQLTANNLSRPKGRTAYLEIPTEFWRSYSLQNVVKLQGIHKESHVRLVACQFSDDGRQTRLYFRGGWRDFSDDNGLEVGQVLVFTLTADSFFEVREITADSFFDIREDHL